MEFEAEVNRFLEGAQKHGLRVIMVGGAAVNHHGYKRHSADVDLWIEPSAENFGKLLAVLNHMRYEIDELPQRVLNAEQNNTIKISPEQEVQLITRFNPGCTFDEAWSRCEFAETRGFPLARYRVPGSADLIASKSRSASPKDLLDVQELKRRKE